jgi:ferrous iron transport protein B
VRQLRVALAGNPNCGKSTVFNRLTGAQQHVGNWPGKTVARKEGYYQDGDTRVALVDLPGTYSLSAYSPEEQIARDFIVRQQPDVVVNVLDTANLERNLFLTAQILEAGAPLIIVLNMSDVAARRGYLIDVEQLSRRLGGVPVIRAVASHGEGLQSLREAIRIVGSQTLANREHEMQGDGSTHGTGEGTTDRESQLWGCH